MTLLRLGWLETTNPWVCKTNSKSEERCCCAVPWLTSVVSMCFCLLLSTMFCVGVNDEQKTKRWQDAKDKRWWQCVVERGLKTGGGFVCSQYKFYDEILRRHRRRTDRRQHKLVCGRKRGWKSMNSTFFSLFTMITNVYFEILPCRKPEFRNEIPRGDIATETSGKLILSQKSYHLLVLVEECMGRSVEEMGWMHLLHQGWRMSLLCGWWSFSELGKASNTTTASRDAFDHRQISSLWKFETIRGRGTIALFSDLVTSPSTFMTWRQESTMS